MSATYVIRNQLGQYFTRKGEWASGREAAILYHQPHYDQALNQLIEINAKDIALRGEVIELAVNEKKRPVVIEFGPEPEQAGTEQGETEAALASDLDFKSESKSETEHKSGSGTENHDSLPV